MSSQQRALTKSKIPMKGTLTAEDPVTSSAALDPHVLATLTVSVPHAAVGSVWMPVHAQTESRTQRRLILTGEAFSMMVASMG